MLIGAALALIMDIVTLGWWLDKIGMGWLCVMSQFMSAVGYFLLSTVGIGAGPSLTPPAICTLNPILPLTGQVFANLFAF